MGRKRIARLMRAAGLKGVSRRKGIRTTKRADDAPSLDPLSTRVKRLRQSLFAGSNRIPRDAWSGLRLLGQFHRAAVVAHISE